MALEDYLTLSATILASLGGGSLIVASMSSWLGKVWADRLMRKEMAAFSKELEELKAGLQLESESHKVRLRKSEILFQRELDAVSEFISLFREVLPRHQWPNMDWYDACDEIARGFGKTELRLNDFLTKHGAAVRDDVVELIVRCLSIAGEGKFDIDGPEVPAQANKAANDLYEAMISVEKKMLSHVRQQVGT